jgi:carboxyl-terminal processing protease
VVVNVRKDSPAALQGIVAGNTLLAIDGKPAMQWWQATLAQTRKNSTERARQNTVGRVLNAGSPEAPSQTVELKLAGNDGTPFTATVARTIVPVKPSVSSKILPSGYGYLNLSAFDAKLGGEIRTAMAKIRSAPGIMIDLRGNGGGSQAIAAGLMGAMVEGKIQAGKTLTRTGKPITAFMGLLDLSKPEFVLTGQRDPYRGKVVVLIDDGSASASELTAATLQGLGRAKVVGETSCGCLLGYLGLTNVPGGGAMAYSELDFEPPGGGRIEGKGVVPDVPVQLTRANLVAGKDAVLDAATTLLDQMTGKATVAVAP